MANTTTTPSSMAAVKNHEENGEIHDENCTPSDIRQMNNDSTTISNLGYHDDHVQAPALISHNQLCMNGDSDNSEMG